MGCIRILILLMVSFSSLSTQAQDKDERKSLNVQDLPRSAVLILENHFNDCKIISITRKTRDNGYRVEFSDKKVIQFSEIGEWTYINCRKTSVPLLLIPSKIRNMIAQKYGPQAFPTMMCKFKQKFKLILDNQIELEMKASF